MYDVQMADKGTTNMLEPYSDGSVTLRGSFRWCSLQQPVSLKKDIVKSTEVLFLSDNL